MRVLFDISQIQYSIHCGVFKYATRILDGWVVNGITDVCILTNDTFEEECRKRWPGFRTLSLEVPNTGYLRRGLVTSLRRKRIIDRSGCDVVFVPMFEPLFAFIPSIPVVMTVHDLQAYKVFTGKLWWYNALGFPWQVMNSRKVISITAYTESQLKSHWFYRSPKGTVVHNPVTYDKSIYAPLVDYPYILCVNTIVEYKNQLTLVRAFKRLADKIEHKLVLVGNEIPAYWQEISDFIEKEGLQDRVVHMKNLSEEDLVALYQHASLFVTPSMMEGFGQTPIEAAIYGSPVVSSRCTALTESTLGLVDYYEPVLSDESLATKMMEVLGCTPNREHLVEVAERFKKEYDCSSQSLMIYNQVIGI